MGFTSMHPNRLGSTTFVTDQRVAQRWALLALLCGSSSEQDNGE
jgi:hypothetical protein